MLLNLDQLVEKYKMDIRGVVHAGGHHGQEIPMYKKLGLQREQILVFEPVPQTFKILESRCNNDATLVNLALGNECKKVTIYTEEANQGQSSSILPLGKHLEFYPHIQYTGSVEADMVTLDSWMEGRRDKGAFNFLICDVQGFDFEVIKGAEKTLEGIDYVMSEVNTEELYKGCGLLPEMTNFLADRGFELVELVMTNYSWGDGFWKSNKK